MLVQTFCIDKLTLSETMVVEKKGLYQWSN